MTSGTVSRAGFLAQAAAGLAALFGAGAAAAKPTPASKKAYTMVVLSNPKPGREADFNDWYDHKHMPQVLQTPGFVSAQRFELAAQPPGGPATPPWRYYSAYRIETEDPKKALDALIGRFASGELTPTDAMADNYFAVFEAMGPVVHAPVLAKVRRN
jgi:hypothetical protein